MYGFETKKSLGQHFLTSDAIPKKLCDAAALEKGDLVLEIGPGTGALTKELLIRGARVVALEADRRAITVLEETFSEAIASEQLTVIQTDVRSYDPANDSHLQHHTYKVVANIPYYLSGLLFRTFLTSQHQPDTLVFLVQKEVAKRATSSLAHGQKESLLSISLQAYGEATYVTTVGRGHFSPPPKVDSAIVAVTNISRHRLAGLNEELLWKILHLGFGQKRKQLLGNLAGTFDRGVLESVFDNMGLPRAIRAEDVSFPLWCQLAIHLQSTQ